MQSTQEQETVAVNVNDEPWVSIEEVWRGCSMKVLHHDPETSLLVALFKFEPGTQLPRHQHPSDGHGFILEGFYVEGGKPWGPWTYVKAPAGLPHGDNAQAGPEGYVALGWYHKGSGIYEDFLRRRGLI